MRCYSWDWGIESKYLKCDCLVRSSKGVSYGENTVFKLNKFAE